jgi:C4-dicarboxylate transporter
VDTLHEQSEVCAGAVPWRTAFAAFQEQAGGFHDQFAFGLAAVVTAHAFAFEDGLHHIGKDDSVVQCDRSLRGESG